MAHTGQLIIDGEEFIVIRKADYEALAGGNSNKKTAPALPFVLGALGRNLKAARDHAGLTQEELAKKLGKAQTTVSGSESGKIRVSEKYVAKVLKVCGLPLDWRAPVARAAPAAKATALEAMIETVLADLQKHPEGSTAEAIRKRILAAPTKVTTTVLLGVSPKGRAQKATKGRESTA